MYQTHGSPEIQTWDSAPRYLAIAGGHSIWAERNNGNHSLLCVGLVTPDGCCNVTVATAVETTAAVQHAVIMKLM